MRSTTLMWSVIAVGSCTSVMAVLATGSDTPTLYFLRDPNAIARQPFYYSMVESIGYILWIVSATVLLLTAYVYWSVLKEREASRFFAFGGLLSAMLGADDMFMLHESAFPQAFGVNQKLLFPIYGMLNAGYLFAYRLIILRSSFGFLLIAFACLGGAIVLDDKPGQYPIPVQSEDILEFFGIVFWCAYFLKTSTDALRQRLGGQRSTPMSTPALP